jgi:hypothetical protein
MTVSVRAHGAPGVRRRVQAAPPQRRPQCPPLNRAADRLRRAAKYFRAELRSSWTGVPRGPGLESPDPSPSGAPQPGTRARRAPRQVRAGRPDSSASAPSCAAAHKGARCARAARKVFEQSSAPGHRAPGGGLSLIISKPAPRGASEPRRQFKIAPRGSLDANPQQHRGI